MECIVPQNTIFFIFLVRRTRPDSAELMRAESLEQYYGARQLLFLRLVPMPLGVLEVSRAMF
jgi:hypothetical protein